MIPATFTLLVAAASTNALPIFSGFFAPRAVAPAPATTIQRRDLNNTQFAQGTNFYFASLLLEAECTPGQVACVDGKTATCSAEANWEVSPCSEGTTCYAVPASTDPTNDAVVVKCMTQEDATSAFGSTNFSEDFQITAAPFNTTVTSDPSSNPSDSSTTDVPSDSSTTDVPSGTETFSDEPTPTGDDSTPTDSSLPDGTCTEDPEPTETETITVIAISDAQNSDGFSYSTVFPTATETDVTDVPTATETATETATIVDVPTATSCAGTTYQPTELTTCDQVATLYGISSDDVYNNNNFVDCNNIWAYTVLCLPDGSSDPAPSDSSSDGLTPTDSSVSSTEDAAPTTLSVPPSSPSTPANVVPVPEVSIVDTHVIPASSSIVPPANLKMRKVRRS